MTPKEALRVVTTTPMTVEVAEHLRAMALDPDSRVRVIVNTAILRLCMGLTVHAADFDLLFEDEPDGR